MNALFKPLSEVGAYKKIIDSIKKGRTPVLATGVTESQKWHLAAGLICETKRPALIIAPSELKAKEIFEDLYYFFRERVYLYPSRDVIFYAADVKSADITRQRFRALDALFNGGLDALVVSAEALLDRAVPPDVLRENMITLAAGDALPIENLTRRLADMGYTRCPIVEGAGQFALRGGILDIGPPCARTGDGSLLAETHAIRLEFFGDEIDSIRVIDSYSQRSVEKTESATVYPAREFVFDKRRLEGAIEKINSDFEKARAELRRKNMRDEAKALSETVGETVSRLREEGDAPGIESYFPYFYDIKANLADYLPDDALLFVEEPNRVSAHIETVLAEFSDSASHRLLTGHLLPGQAEMILNWEDALHKTSAFDSVLFMSMTQAPKDFAARETAHFDVKSCMPLRRRPSDLREDLAYLLSKDYAVAILAGPRRRGQTLTEEIAAMGLPVRYVDGLEGDEFPRGVITVTRGALAAGFEYPECFLAVVTDRELFATEKTSGRKKSRRDKNAQKIEHYSDLRVGDNIVHDNHGIGVFKGIEQIVTDGCMRDYLKLEYADGGCLYIQTAQMDMIQKYVGGSVPVKLSKLGGADWARAKSRARNSVRVLAEDLVSIYAKRQTSSGFVYGTDTVWQSEFEAQFPYDETEDQTAAIEDVKRDMESGRIMDRLICGDVGYGKTEIAIRAAFKAVQDNKQVAYLVPTTILAQQHYMTFKSRMKDYPMNVERLSRFQSKKEQALTVQKLASGGVDIVIGTHRLLSKDVRFNNLGLIIVDEEQRFGVSHKEKLKTMKSDVDVLTLTATPIPRTLHLSLTGIRDMSLLDEPPEERRPVQTYVMEYNAEFVRDAINRELARDGQVYYLHNRVRNIMEEAARVRALVPHARIAYAHGQMSEHELENVMMEFVEGNVQVLVCTTIVETGLDIPNVNTIIIQDADYMGLSQLYQLRGRVGRSNRLAYAYLMYRRDKVLQENAEKRLQTIREFTEFGSGFKIAMRDLEIRGAGTMLGAEQHGHMDSVGYDMYCKLLSEAVTEIKGEAVAEEFETSIDITVNAFIPPEFIADETQKLEIYKKISLIKNSQNHMDVQEEIEDRYGDLPRPVTNLLEVALLKAEAHAMGAISVTQKQNAAVITFKPDALVNAEKLHKAIQSDPSRLKFTMTPSPHITYRCGVENDDGSGMVKAARKLLGAIIQT